MVITKTNKIARYVKEPRGLETTSHRSGQSKLAGLYLLELRSHHAVAQSPLPKRKLVLKIELKDRLDAAPKLIKITYL